jgi:hypothetical protein
LRFRTNAAESAVAARLKGEIGRGGEATTMGGEEDEETDSHVARLRGWENRKPGEADGGENQQMAGRIGSQEKQWE